MCTTFLANLVRFRLLFVCLIRVFFLFYITFVSIRLSPILSTTSILMILSIHLIHNICLQQLIHIHTFVYLVSLADLFRQFTIFLAQQLLLNKWIQSDVSINAVKEQICSTFYGLLRILFGNVPVLESYRLMKFI